MVINFYFNRFSPFDFNRNHTFGVVDYRKQMLDMMVKALVARFVGRLENRHFFDKFSLFHSFHPGLQLLANNHACPPNSLEHKIMPISWWEANPSPISSGVTQPGQMVAVADKVDIARNERLPQEWKLFPENAAAEFKFNKPEVSFEGISLSNAERKAIEEKAMSQYKAAMTALDHSIADASLGMVGDKHSNPELLETLNKFSDRYLDVYKAYLEVLQEEKQPFFTADIGVAKSFGFTHEDIVSFIEPAKWYQQECTTFKQKAAGATSSPDIAEGCIHYLSQNNFSFKTLDNLGKNPEALIQGTNCSQKQLSKALEDPRFFEDAKTFCGRINGNKVEGNKIKTLGKKFAQFGGGIDVIENLKKSLATCDLTNTIDKVDFSKALLEELKGRIGDGFKEPGYIDPELMLDVIEGKNDHRDPISRMRHKLYFIYKSKGIANEIAKSPALVDKVNEKLAKKGWQLDKGVCDYLHAQSPDSPIFKFGSYAAENWKGNVRGRATAAETQAKFAAYGPRTFGQAGEIADKVNNVAVEELMKPYRFKMSPEEEMTYLKSVFGKEKGSLISKKCDRVAFERLLENSKHTTPQPWIPGKYFFNLADKSKSESPYLKAVDAVGLPQQAGISGSTDQTLTMAGMVGITSLEEIERLRLMYLGWMTSHDDHSVDEILTAAKSFGLAYTPGPDYYKQIYPKDPSFQHKLSAAQQQRGYELPDFYLSKEYARQCLEEIRTNNNLEQVQAHAIEDKLAHHNLFMKAIVCPKDAKVNDLFQKEAWKPFLHKLNTEKKMAPDNGKVKYTYNPVSKKLEPHQKSPEPFYEGTKKTSVSLLPSHGKIIPYGSERDESVGLLFDRAHSQYKDKYIFKGDALTDNKWWRRFYTQSEIDQPDFQEKLDRAVKEIQAKDGQGKKKSYNHLRLNSLEALIAEVDKVANFNKHNEILASLNKEGVVGVFAYNKKVSENSKGAELYTRLKGIANKVALKDQQGLDVPLFLIDQARDQGLNLYSTQQQQEDLKALMQNANGEFDAVVSYLGDKAHADKDTLAANLRDELHDLQQAIA